MLATVATFKDIISHVTKYSIGALDELPKLKKGSYKFLGLGKSAGSLCESLVDLYGGEGVVFTKKNHAQHHPKLEYYEGGHPHIDDNSFANGRVLYRFLQDINPDDVLIVCLTGGASAVVELPAKGIKKSELVELNNRLVHSGKDISIMNMLRKEVSLIKNGGLLSLVKCKEVITYVVSDVPFQGEEMWATVGSSPTYYKAPDSEVLKDLIANYCKGLPSILDFFANKKDKELRSKKEQGVESSTVQYKEIANYEILKQYCSSLIPGAQIVSEPFRGVLEDGIANWLLELKEKGNGEFISGGEWTVTAPEEGVGGRCTHFVLLASKLIYEDLILGTTDVEIISIATDGGDGDTDCAGAWMDFKTYQESQKLGLSIGQFLDEYRSYDFFKSMGTLIKTGPTKTNIMDLRYIHVFSP